MGTPVSTVHFSVLWVNSSIYALVNYQFILLCMMHCYTLEYKYFDKSHIPILPGYQIMVCLHS